MKINNLKTFVLFLVLNYFSLLPLFSQVDTAWVRRYNGLAMDDDKAQAMAVDNSGNVYVTGYSYDLSTFYDYLTIKYSSSGQVLWIRRYNGPISKDDKAKAIVVDNYGNIYVTGYSEGPGTFSDYVTIKYDSNGNQLWVRRYNYGYDEATALAVDSYGNIYATGVSSGDYATIKYSPEGEELWVRRYNGLGNGYDQANAIAVDNFGNVYVTGSSQGEDNYYDFLTIKYSPEGEELWVRRYSRSPNSDDEAYAIAVDDTGNVYVTGYSYNDIFESEEDYITIKYSSEGEVLWIRRYNGPGDGEDVATALAIDNLGNVYVTGYSEDANTSYDYATIKYSPDGEEIWVRRYNGEANYIDKPSAMAIDNFGNIYVTGYSYSSFLSYDCLTIKYSSNGEELWVRRYQESSESKAQAIAVDNLGNVSVTGYASSRYSNYNYLTIKYDTYGNELWVRKYNGPGSGDDIATALTIDNSGNLYVTGYSYGWNSDYDYLTIKYSFEGEELWIKRYNGQGNGEDKAYGIAVDNSGNVYVTGCSKNYENGGDYLTIKYSPNGWQMWAHSYNGPANYEDFATALALDDSGNIYVTGYSYGLSSSYDYATIKYSPGGRTLWIRRYNSLENRDDIATALLVDNQGNVYVAGHSYHPITSWDYTIIKYSPNGEILWIKKYNGPDNGSDQVTALAIDNLGNLYVTGRSSDDYATIKYSPEGEELWVRRYNGLGNDEDIPNAIAVDNLGNVYIAGKSVGLSSSYDYLTIKYSPEGEELWVRRYNGPANGWDEARAIAIDNLGNVYVTGYSLNTSLDYTTIKYSTNGEELWVVRFNNPEDCDDIANSIAVDNFGNIYITGGSKYSGSSYDYVTIKYIQFSQIKEEKIMKIKREKFKEKEEIYDLTGKLIKKRKLKKGIYFQRTEKGIEKILILK